ncbi:hypothetical protein HNQ39_003239 [Armatimonas rosea]|uniref:Uncharacterized protein n=1 Tax=Armatimonas rosea TaxID=685828 RepID=A0A7W9SSM5_ARMRO|nr:hypothetical protein [Armatimonas rosea]
MDALPDKYRSLSKTVLRFPNGVICRMSTILS